MFIKYTQPLNAYHNSNVKRDKQRIVYASYRNQKPFLTHSNVTSSDNAPLNLAKNCSSQSLHNGLDFVLHLSSTIKAH